MIEQTLKRKLPDLDSKIHFTLRVRDRGHRRPLPTGHRTPDPVTLNSNPHLLALEPLHLQLHLSVHLDRHRETLLLFEIRPEASERFGIQILGIGKNSSEAGLVVLVRCEGRQRAVADGDVTGVSGDRERVIGENKMVVRVFGDEGEIEEGGEVRGGVRRRGEVQLGNAKIGDGELGAVRTVEDIEGSTDNGSEKEEGEEEED